MVQIHPEWKLVLGEEFEKPYFKKIVSFLKEEKAKGKVIYPTGNNIFRAFDLTPPSAIKVVILGQDPYHGEGQAHGLCFSVNKGIAIPPSLLNIYKEIKNNYPLYNIPTDGDLSHWASQGVLLLNSILTVQANSPASHNSIGWQEFTDSVLSKISNMSYHIVFMLWGKYAQQKATLINATKHLLLQAPHPSPFSAQTGFLGCHHFSKCNEYLIQHGKSPIRY